MTLNEYDRERQRIMFRCAIDLYNLAIRAQGIDQGRIDNTDRQARAIEDMGHEQCVASTRDEMRLGRARAAVKTSANLDLKARIIEQLSTREVSS